MKLQLLTFAVLMSVASPIIAIAQQPSFEKGSGLAQILARADKCQYKINQKSLTDYYNKHGLTTPEMLAWISHKMDLESGWAEQTSSAECAMTKATAQAIGITDPEN